MQVILLKPVRKLGKIGEIVNIKDGYGRNFLIPGKFAIRVTKSNLELFEQQKIDFEKNNQDNIANAKKLIDVISGKDVSFIRQSADDGRLFGSVNAKEIARELAKKYNYAFKHSNVFLENPIKTTGISEVEIILHTEVSTKILVNIARSESEAADSLKNYINSLTVVAEAV